MPAAQASAGVLTAAAVIGGLALFGVPEAEDLVGNFLVVFLIVGLGAGIIDGCAD